MLLLYGCTATDIRFIRSGLLQPGSLLFTDLPVFLEFPIRKNLRYYGFYIRRYNREKVRTERFISYRKHILQITQPSQNRWTQLQYRFAVISEAPSIWYVAMMVLFKNFTVRLLQVDLSCCYDINFKCLSILSASFLICRLIRTYGQSCLCN